MSFFNVLESLVDELTTEKTSLNSEGGFTEIAVGYLIENYQVSDYQESYFFAEDIGASGQLKINGYSIDDLTENSKELNLFITDYCIDQIPQTLDLKKCENLFKQLRRALDYVIRTDEISLPKYHSLYPLFEAYTGSEKFRESIDRISLYLLTNNVAVNRKEIDPSRIFSSKQLDEPVSIVLNIVDLKELERLHKGNQKTHVDVAEFYDKPIEILKPELDNDGYKTAISILPGEFLFKIYEHYGPSLLESNVRAFLSRRTKVNQGIEKTILKNPEMFLAYNNGLCITVSEVVLNEDGRTVKEFRDFQIVNGGQTTSSIFFATVKARKERKEVKLDRLHVMAKITEVSRNIDAVKIQTTIARNSNLQNPVKESDLSTNTEYLINLHALSKKYKNSALNSYFYFEKGRGQYDQQKNLSSDKKLFDKLYPKSQRIQKQDLSLLYFIIFKEKVQPFISVWSAEKRFNLMKPDFDDQNKLLGQDYFSILVGGQILYNNFQKIHGLGANAVGRIRKNVLAYSIALIQHFLIGQKKSIDFSDIWNKGQTGLEESEVRDFLIYVNDLILEVASDGRTDEACKKESTWKRILERVDENRVNTFSGKFTVCPSASIFNIKKGSEGIENRHKALVEEMNLFGNRIENYEKIHRRVEDEIKENLNSGKMGLYSRSHLRKLKEHFRPDSKLSAVEPISYELYLSSCTNNNGGIVKSKLKDLHDDIADLYRIYTAVINDDKLIL